MNTRATLLNHCGARRVTADALALLPDPEPMGPRHHPIRHELLRDNVLKALGDRGMELVDEALALTPDSSRAFGVGRIIQAGDDNGNGWSMALGWMNDDAKKLSAKLLLGTGVFVCDNLCFSAEHVIGRKHTRFIERDLGNRLEVGLQRFDVERERTNRRFQTYREWALEDDEADALILQSSLDDGVIPAAAIPDVRKEWKEPRFEEFAEEGPTVWRMMNAFTTVMNRRRGIFTLPNRTTRLHNRLDTLCELSFN